MGLIFAILLLEVALRITTPPTFLQSSYATAPWIVSDPILGWTNRAGFENSEFKINSLGFRGDEVPKPKPEGSIRIVVMGDSGTFGFWESWPKVIEHDTYTDALREHLRSGRHLNVEVINAGVIGYTSANGVRMLMTDILEIEPDIVTVRYTHNDYTDVRNPESYIDEPSQPLLRWMLYNLDGWRLVRLGARVVQRVNKNKHEDKRPQVTPSQFKKNMERFVETARSESIQILFIDYPLSEQNFIPWTAVKHYIRTSGSSHIEQLRDIHNAYQDTLKSVAEEYGVPLLETAPFFSRHTASFFSRNDIVHPNDKGAQKIGDMLYRKLLALGWLEQTGPDHPGMTTTHRQGGLESVGTK